MQAAAHESVELCGGCNHPGLLAGYVLWLRPANTPWTAVTSALNAYDYSRALTLAQAVVAKRPNDYYAHWYLGKIYLAMELPYGPKRSTLGLTS